MKRYIALFRGINVGGKNIIPMKDLGRVLEVLGFTNVESYIQSGNVAFNAAGRTRAQAAVIRDAVLKSHGVDAHVILMEADALEAAVANNPYPSNEGKALHFFFLDRAAAKPKLERLNELKSPTESFQLIDKVFYLHAPEGIGRSKLAANIEKCLGVPVTACALCPYPIIPDGTQALCGWDWLAAETKMLD